MDKIKWEGLDEGTRRLKVPGGWLVNVYELESDSVCFYPDPKHEWIVDEPK